MQDVAIWLVCIAGAPHRYIKFKNKSSVRWVVNNSLALTTLTYYVTYCRRGVLRLCVDNVNIDDSCANGLRLQAFIGWLFAVCWARA